LFFEHARERYAARQAAVPERARARHRRSVWQRCWSAPGDQRNISGLRAI